MRNGHGPAGQSLPDRLALYKQMDETRHEEFSHLAQAVLTLEEQLRNSQADLEDEQATRRQYRRRAEEAESAASRNQFALVLVDGDGYVFKDAFLQDAARSGGADAASHLYNEIQNYLRANSLIPNTGDIEVLVNVYANKSGLARTLYDAGMTDHPNALETFFQSCKCPPSPNSVHPKLHYTEGEVPSPWYQLDLCRPRKTPPVETGD